MKRIAIQYSGQIRNILDCFNNNYEHLIEKNPEYEVDIFAHFWCTEQDSDDKKNRISNLLNAKTITFQNQIDFNRTDIVQDPRFSWYTPNMVSMFYGIETVNNFRKTYQVQQKIKYDYVIRIRSDIIFVANCINPIDHYEKDFIHLKDYSPYQEHGINFAINDYFAIGSPELMDKYCSVYTNLNKMIDEGAPVNPECLLGYNIKDLPNKRHEFRMWPYRYAIDNLLNIRNMNVG